METTQSLTNARNAIFELMPQWAAEKYIKGEQPIESESGYLVIIDLKSSSKIAATFGSEVWSQFIKSTMEPIYSSIVAKYNGKIHQVIWDAFYICIPSNVPHAETFLMVIQMVDELIRATTSPYLDNNFTSVFPKGTNNLFARAALVFGDTTRGLTPPPNPTWSIIGSTMAVASKLEQAAKGAPGDIFVVSKTVPLNLMDYFIKTDRWIDAASDYAASIETSSVGKIVSESHMKNPDGPDRPFLPRAN